MSQVYEAGPTDPQAALVLKAGELVDLLGLIDLPAAILDASAGVLRATKWFDELLPSLPVTVSGARLGLGSVARHKRFSQAFRRVLDAGLGWRTIMSLGDGCLVTLIRYSIEGQPVVVLIVSERLASSRVCPACLMRLFDLTPRETDLVMQIVAGRRIQEAAVALGTTVGTARTHLRHIFQKAQVETQSELVALIASCAFGRCPPEAESCCRTVVVPVATAI